MLPEEKDSFFFYFMKKTGGLHDPALLTKTIEALKEWLPYSVGCPDSGYPPDSYELGQREYKDFLMEKLK